MQTPSSSTGRYLRTINCAACAKRKVRCDRQDPCGHCKRRRDDCIYPSVQSYHGQSRNGVSKPNGAAQAQKSRIARLERYIRDLGVDPNLLEELSEEDLQADGTRKTVQSAAERDISCDAENPEKGPQPDNQPDAGIAQRIDEEQYIETYAELILHSIN